MALHVGPATGVQTPGPALGSSGSMLTASLQRYRVQHWLPNLPEKLALYFSNYAKTFLGSLLLFFLLHKHPFSFSLWREIRLGGSRGHFAAADKPKFFTSCQAYMCWQCLRFMLLDMTYWLPGLDAVRITVRHLDVSVNTGSDLDLSGNRKPFACNILAPLYFRLFPNHWKIYTFINKLSWLLLHLHQCLKLTLN